MSVIRLELAGAWYIDARPSGAYAALYPSSRIRTWRGDVPLPPGGDLLYLRCWESRGLCLAGQGHDDGRAWLWADEEWHDLGDCYGTSPCTFGPEGLYVSGHGAMQNLRVFDLHTRQLVTSRTQPIGARGIAHVDASGTVFSVDGWYGDGGFAEYTDLGGIRIGQGAQGGLVVRVGTGPLRLIEPGSVMFVRASTDVDRVAVATWKDVERRAVLHWLTLAELDTLPLVSTVTAPPPPDPDPEPEPEPMPERHHADVVARIAATIPHERTLAYAWTLVKAVSWELRGEGCGLHQRPSGGENVMTVDGETYGASRVMYPDGDLYKLVSDAGDGGANGPQWAREEPIDPARWRPALKPDGTVPDQPPPDDARLAQIEARLTALEGPRRVALKTENGHYLCAENGGGGEVNATRDAPGSWETFILEPKL